MVRPFYGWVFWISERTEGMMEQRD